MTTATNLPVHPFPARMAPELALRQLPKMKRRRLVVLDPMMGSGTIPILASVNGYDAIGFDVDPLAILIARTTGRALRTSSFLHAAENVAEWARAHRHKSFRHPDAETHEFIDYWFDSDTQRHLGALATNIKQSPTRWRAALWCAFSRLIITKDAGASRARDVSHSRPHRVRDRASFDPIEQFVGAAEAIAHRHRLLGDVRAPATALQLRRGDARKLRMATSAVDAVITSPPYLQAIDYMRGHRLSLVWMGYSVGELRNIRAGSIGSERGAEVEDHYSAVLSKVLPPDLDKRGRQIVARYVNDCGGVIREIQRVLRQGGQATFVVADATVRGVPILVSGIVDELMKTYRMSCIDRIERPIATASRYLPPPTDGSNTLDKRMRVEHCLTYRR
ncbi:MAG TPA: hypothetical protein VL979_05660 [Solirubrobacteraceae bacterium]|nr:hypothetical protein [Solirubrobacteraceae bacterium]